MVLTETGLAKVFQRVKSFVVSQLNSKASVIHTHTSSDITDLPSGLMVDSALSSSSENAVQNKVVKNALDGKSDTGHTHTKSDITNFPTLSTVATSGDYDDLTNKPTIPTVNNATLKIQKNGTDVKTFTANASSDVTCNITVPTKVSELANDSGFLTSHQSLSNYSTLANTIKSLSISGKTITYTKGDNTTGTLTTQDNNTWTAMKGATSSANGSVGYVNAVPPKDGYNTKYLRADGTWQVPPDHTYTVNNATLTIQKNGSNVATFTANASSNVTCNITVPTKTSDLTNDSGFLTSVLPIGSYIQFAGSQAPAGFLVCNGGEISRTTYSALFAVIGTTYGSGDGSTTFNLPNLTDRFLQGSSTSGTVKNAGLPNIVGNASPCLPSIGNVANILPFRGYDGALRSNKGYPEKITSNYVSQSGATPSIYWGGVGIDASRSDSIYGNSSTVQPPALTCLICIKY